MKKYLIGYKQANDSYVYVNTIEQYNIRVGNIVEAGLDFVNETMATNVCEFLNKKDMEHTYVPIIVTTNIEEIVIEEVVEDVITNE